MFTEVLPSMHQPRLFVKNLASKRTRVSYSEAAPMFFFAVFVMLIAVGLASELEGVWEGKKSFPVDKLKRMVSLCNASVWLGAEVAYFPDGGCTR
jgi:hypothetical protein